MRSSVNKHIIITIAGLVSVFVMVGAGCTTNSNVSFDQENSDKNIDVTKGEVSETITALVSETERTNYFFSRQLEDGRDMWVLYTIRDEQIRETGLSVPVITSGEALPQTETIVAAVSPDEQYVAYMQPAEWPNRIYQVGIDGMLPKEIVGPKVGDAPAHINIVTALSWADNEHLLYSESSEDGALGMIIKNIQLFKLNVETGEKEVIRDNSYSGENTGSATNRSFVPVGR